MIRIKVGQEVFNKRVGTLVAETDDVIRWAVKGGKTELITPRVQEAILSNEVLAQRTGDNLLLNKTKTTTQTLIDNGVISADKAAEIKKLFNGWVSNTIDKGIICKESDAVEFIGRLLSKIPGR